MVLLLLKFDKFLQCIIFVSGKDLYEKYTCGALAPEQKEKFIELRAKGFSFDKISKEINVSKQTLIKWQNEFRTEISNREFLNYQNIIEKHQLFKTNKIEILTGVPACCRQA